MSSGAFGGGWWDGRRAIDGYQPVVPDHWVFDGVTFPQGGITGGEDTPVIGYETDGVRLERGSLTHRRLSEHRRGGSGGRTLLALGKAVGRLGRGLRPGQRGDHDQDRAVGRDGVLGRHHRLAAGAGTDPAISQITANVVDRLPAGPLRIRGPVCAESEYIGEGELVGAGQQASWYIDGGQVAA